MNYEMEEANPDQADEPQTWQSAFDERHEFDVYPDHFVTGMKNEFCAGWHAALKARESTAPTTGRAPGADDPRKVFESLEANKYLDMDKDLDAWDRPRFKHMHIEARYQGWLLSYAAPPANAPVASVPLIDAAKAFFNATIADTTVIIRAPSVNKRDNIKRLGEELRALLAASMGGNKS